MKRLIYIIIVALAILAVFGAVTAEAQEVGPQPEYDVAPGLLIVDGETYWPTKVSGPVFHYETPDTYPQEAFTPRNVWTGHGSDNLPCEGGIHWIDNESLLTISHCLPVTTTTTTTQPTTTTTSTVPTTTSTEATTTTTTEPTTTSSSTTTTTNPPSTTTSSPPGTVTTSVPPSSSVPQTTVTVPTTLPVTGVNGDQLMRGFWVALGFMVMGTIALLMARYMGVKGTKKYNRFE